MEERELPTPDSEELASLFSGTSHRLLYGLLYRRRDGNPPTMVEIRAFSRDALGDEQSQIDRRVRDLRRYFVIDAERQATGETRYILKRWVSNAETVDGTAISQRRRAEVLRPGRCAMCGRTALEHQVVLVVDHKLPRTWGGTNDPENLQPLCEECNAGKRDYFRSFEHHGDEIRKAANWDEPQQRIGELLKAFKGEWVRTDLLSIVASAKEYQEDWQRRLRDLRFLGWTIEHQKRYDEGARVWTYYRATTWAPYPDNIPTAIREESKRRKDAKKKSTN